MITQWQKSAFTFLYILYRRVHYRLVTYITKIFRMFEKRI